MRVLSLVAAVLSLGLSAAALAQQPSQPLFLKYGGEVREEGRVIPPSSRAGQPLTVLEEREAALRVRLNGGAGWIDRSQVGTREEVLQDVSGRIADQPDNVELRLFRVHLIAARGTPSERQQALADLVQIVEQSPQDPRGYHLRGSLLAKGREFVAAIDDFTRSLKLDDKFAPALLERGLAYYALGDLDGSLADLDAYVRLEPKDPQGFVAKAVTYVEREQYERAEADFAAAIERDDRSPVPWFERGRMWMRRHDASKAVADLSESLQRDRGQLDATLFLATLLACGPDDTPRDGKRALELATTACQLAPGDHRPMEALAAAYAESGKLAQAVEQQQKALTTLEKKGAQEGAKAAARYRLEQYQSGKPVRLMQ